MLIVTILSISICGSLADLPSGHCLDGATQEWIATSVGEAERDWQYCLSRREEFKQRLSDPDIVVECDQDYAKPTKSAFKVVL